MPYKVLIEDYATGPARFREAVTGLTAAQLDAVPVAGQWSTRQVVCHVADFEIVYADRMKRVLAEEQPTLFGGDPDQFAARLAYTRREVETELQVIEAVRQQMTQILGTLPAEEFLRQGIHAQAGPVTLEKLLTQITLHVPHHTKFILQKRNALGA
ncbi:MAG: DinB family protein [Planctomycetales bacterium]|nr:DinB family protein [Planctomycetales bacterium]